MILQICLVTVSQDCSLLVSRNMITFNKDVDMWRICDGSFLMFRLDSEKRFE